MTKRRLAPDRCGQERLRAGGSATGRAL